MHCPHCNGELVYAMESGLIHRVYCKPEWDEVIEKWCDGAELETDIIDIHGEGQEGIYCRECQRWIQDYKLTELDTV